MSPPTRRLLGRLLLMMVILWAIREVEILRHEGDVGRWPRIGEANPSSDRLRDETAVR